MQDWSADETRSKHLHIILKRVSSENTVINQTIPNHIRCEMEWEIKSKNHSNLSRSATDPTKPTITTITCPIAQSGEVTHCCSRTLAETWCWFRRTPSPAGWPWCVWLSREEWALFSCSALCVGVCIYPPACCSQAVSRQVVYAALAAWKWCDKTMLMLLPERINTAPVLPSLFLFLFVSRLEAGWF